MMSEWMETTLGEIADVCWGDTSTTKSSYVTKGFPAYSASGRDGYLDHADYNRTGVVLSAIGADCGRTWLAKGKWSCIKNTIRFWSTVDYADTTFLYYKTLGKDFWPKRGSAQPFISQGDARTLPVSLPTLGTQRRIAAVLSALDDKIELNNRINANLEAQAQALFRRAHGPDDEQTNLTNVISVLSGGTPRTERADYWNGDIPFFSPKDIGHPFTILTERMISRSGLDACNSDLYPPYTTLVTARGTVGKVSLAGVPLAMNQSCFALASNEIHPLLVYFYVLDAVQSLKQKASGSVFDAIVVRDFESESAHRLAPSSEVEFVKTVEPFYIRILKNTLQNHTLSAIRDALLPKLMSGEIDVSQVEIPA